MEFNKERIKILFLSILYFSLLSHTTYSQNDNLFGKDLDMKAQLTYNFKDLYKNTNDSSFIKSQMVYSANGIDKVFVL